MIGDFGVCTTAGSKGFGPGFSWPDHRGAKKSKSNSKPLRPRKNSTGWKEGFDDWWSDFVSEPKQVLQPNRLNLQSNTSATHQYVLYCSCKSVQIRANPYKYTWGMTPDLCLAWERSDWGPGKGILEFSPIDREVRGERWGEVTVGQHICSGHVSIV